MIDDKSKKKKPIVIVQRPRVETPVGTPIVVEAPSLPSDAAQPHLIAQSYDVPVVERPVIPEPIQTIGETALDDMIPPDKTTVAPGMRPRQVVPTVIKTPQQQRDEYQEIIDSPQPTKDRNGRLKSAGLAVLSNLGHVFDPAAGVVRDFGDLGARLAYAGGGGIGSVINPKYDEIQAWERQKNEAQGKLQGMNAEDERQFQLKERQSRIDDRNTDNVIKRDALKRLQDKDEADAIAKTASAATNQQKFLMGQIFKRGYYKTGEQPALDAQLKTAGLEIDDYDNRDYDKIVENGVTKVRRKGSNDPYTQATGTEGSQVDMPLHVRTPSGAIIPVTPRMYYAAQAADERQRLGFEQQNRDREDRQAFQSQITNEAQRQAAVTKAAQMAEDWFQAESKYREVTPEEKRAKWVEFGKQLGLQPRQ